MRILHLSLRILVVSLLFSNVGGVLASIELDARLLEAVLDEDLSNVERLVALGANPNSIQGSRKNEWAMCAATSSERLEILRILLRSGGDPNLPNKLADFRYSLPLSCAVRNDNLEGVRMLLSHGAENMNIPCSDCGTVHPKTVFQEAIFSRALYEAFEISKFSELGKEDLLVIKYMLENQRFDLSLPETSVRYELGKILESHDIEFKIWTPENDSQKLRDKADEHNSQ